MVPRVSLTLAMSSDLLGVLGARVEKPRSRKCRRAFYAETIEILGSAMPFPCSTCRRQKRSCRISESSADCAECVRHGAKECDVGLSRVQVARLKETKDRLERELEEAEDAEVAAMMKKRQVRKQLAMVDVRANEMLAKEEIIRQRLDAQDEADMAALAANIPVGPGEVVVQSCVEAPSAPTVPTLDQEINSFYSSSIGDNDVAAPGS